MAKKPLTMHQKHPVAFGIITAFAIICFWRGAWGLLDEYLFPHHPELSLWFSIAIGIIILLVTGYTSKEVI